MENSLGVGVHAGVPQGTCSKMSFNPDPNKQAIEVRFSNKRDKENYPSL